MEDKGTDDQDFMGHCLATYGMPSHISTTYRVFDNRVYDHSLAIHSVSIMMRCPTMVQSWYGQLEYMVSSQMCIKLGNGS